MKPVTPTFTISLDFELHWGGFEKWPLEYFREYFLNTRSAIPQMLALFEKYSVHVTWATVGMLLAESRKELLELAPSEKPSYDLVHLSAYEYIDKIGIGENEEEDPFHFAPSIVSKILSTPFQELGSHTYAHFYCNEKGQTLSQFRADLKAVQRISAKYKTKAASLVFPRNQFNDQYLQVCYEEGITSVRSNPSDWFWKIESTQGESAWKRINRGLDAYFPLGKKNTFKAIGTPRKGFPVCIPASRLLRPYRPAELFLNKLKIRRIKREIADAAILGKMYHLWWHPHNFGHHPKESLDALESILQHYRHCQKKSGMQSLTMAEIASLYGSNSKVM